jgi:hypothetical protein
MPGVHRPHSGMTGRWLSPKPMLARQCTAKVITSDRKPERTRGE